MRQPQLPQSNQRGFVLVVCLIILLVLTVLGVNNMGTSNLEARMAANSQNKFATFQVAESAIEDTFASGTDIDSVAATGVPVTTAHNYGSDYTTSTTTTPIAFDPRYLVGYKLNGSFTAYSVEIDATSNSAGTGARAQMALGVTKVAPK